MVVPLVRRERTSDAAAFCPRLEGACGRFRAAGPAGLPPRAAPRLRQPPAAQRGRFAHRADAARPHRHLDDPDLHPRGRGAAEEPGPRPAPAGGEIVAAVAAVARMSEATSGIDDRATCPGYRFAHPGYGTGTMKPP